MPVLTLQFRAPRSAGRRGITLLELLVVMVILSIVTASTIPMLNNGVGPRRIREAARLVASYIGAAKSRAIETGLPSGVMIQRIPGQNYALSVVSVEVPPPYAGDTTSSTATINGLGQLTAFPSDQAWTTTVRVGDLIRFGYQGRLYMLIGNALPPTNVNQFPNFGTSTVGVGQLLSSTGFGTTSTAVCHLWAIDRSLAVPAATAVGSGIPYQIFRQPIKSAVQPLQLPEGTVIELTASGVGIAGLFAAGGGLAPYQNPILTFGPTGAVNMVYYDSAPPQHLQSALYLMVGEREWMTDFGGAGNLNHHSSMWVAVGPQSGMVVTTENMVPNALSGIAQTPAFARQFAQQAASMGGR